MAGYVSVNLGMVTQNKAKMDAAAMGFVTASSLTTTGFLTASDAKGYVAKAPTAGLQSTVVATITKKSSGGYQYDAIVPGMVYTFKTNADAKATTQAAGFNVGHSVTLGEAADAAWTINLGKLDDTLTVANEGANIINTGEAVEGDWVILKKGSNGNTVTYGGNGFFSIASNKNTVTGGGFLGSATGVATLSGNNNVVKAATGYISISGNENNVSVTGGFLTISSGEKNTVIGGAASIKGATAKYSSITSAGFVSLASGKKNTVTGSAAEITLKSETDAVVTGSSNKVTINGGNVDEQGSGDTVTITVTAATVTVSGSGNTVTEKIDSTLNVTGTGNTVNLAAASTNNTIAGSGNTVKTGGTSSSVVLGGTSNTLTGGNGPDTVTVSGSSATVNTGAGADSVSVTGSGNKINLGAGADSITLTGSLNTVTAAAGADSIAITGASNYVDFSGNVDAVRVDDNGTATTVVGGKGAMTANVTGDSKSLTGSEAADNITTNLTNDATISSGGGNDRINVNGGSANVVNVGEGNDTVSLNASYTTVSLVEGNNQVTITAADGHNSIDGGVSSSSITVDAGGAMEGDVLNFREGGNNLVSVVAGATANNTSVLGALKQAANDTLAVAGTSEKLLAALGAGDDQVSITSAYQDTIVSGSGNNNITLAGGKGANVVNLVGDATYGTGGGRNVVSIASGTHNTVITGLGTNSINLAGSTDNLVTISGTSSSSNTVVAGNRDSIATGAGKDVIDGTNVTSTVRLLDYSVGQKDVLRGVGTFSSVNGAGDTVINEAAFVASEATAANPLVFNDAGTIRTAGNGSFNAGVTARQGDNGVQAYVTDGTLTEQGVWFATTYGSNLNAAKDNVAVAMIMTGANNDAADTIIGGTKADTIYVADNDVVSGGQGNDTLINKSNAEISQEQFGIATYTGNDTVTGFDGGFENTNDAVLFYENTLLDGTTVSYDGANNLTITNGTGGKILLANMAKGDSISTNVLLKNGVNGADERLTAVAAGQTVVVDDDTVAKYYYGKSGSGNAGGIDASNLTQGVKIDLGNSGRYFEAGENYSYINKVTGSNGGNNFLAGNGDMKNTLIGGAGVANTLYGGGSSNDSLVAGTGATDSFYFGHSDGKDTISGIHEGDKVFMYDLSNNDVTFAADGTSLVFRTTDNAATLTIENASTATFEVELGDGRKFDVVNGNVTEKK